jgi:hypothetical protein
MSGRCLLAQWRLGPGPMWGTGGLWPRGDMSADGGEIGLFAADIRDGRDRTNGLGFSGTDGAASGFRGPDRSTGGVSAYFTFHKKLQNSQK